MAEAAVDMDCPLCGEEEVELLTLGCEHRFCHRCLRETWAPSQTGDCPQCRRRWSKFLPPAFALEKDLSQNQAESSGEMEEEEKGPEQRAEFVKPGLSQGAASGGDRGETFQSDINKLKEKKERTEGIMEQYKSMLEHTERQRLQCESDITAVFRRLHEFLLQEEESHLSALRKEHQEKTQMIEAELKELEDKLGSLSDRICSEEQGHSSHSSSLTEHMDPLLLTEEEPQLSSGLLIDQASVLGNLAFRVWQKMRTIVDYSPVILDPNTAHGHLHLSEDLTSVRQRETPQELPLNPERFTNYSSVLGSEGLSSGRHQWEVEVGDHPDWSIGVVSESAERRARCRALPEEGFWCLKYRDNKYTDVWGQTVELRRRPEKIRVLLDDDRTLRWIFFYDIRDMTLICSNSWPFTEKVYPYFSVGGAGDDDVTKSIKICPTDAKDGLWEPERFRIHQRSENLRQLQLEEEAEIAQVRLELERLKDLRKREEAKLAQESTRLKYLWMRKQPELAQESDEFERLKYLFMRKEAELAQESDELERLQFQTKGEYKLPKKVPPPSDEQWEPGPYFPKSTQPPLPPESLSPPGTSQSSEKKPQSSVPAPKPDPDSEAESSKPTEATKTV